MPTNRTRRTRSIKKSMIDPSIIVFLLHGEAKKGTAAWTLYLSRFFDECQEIKRTWREHKKELIADWIKKKPCSRPFCWWKFDAPKEPVIGWDHDRFNSPQRKRLGGIGTPTHETTCSWGGFEKGLPCSWDEIDNADPPTFESEGAYLKRHEILTGPEKTFLKKHPELLKPIKVEFNDE